MAKDININISAVGASILNSADPSAVSWIRVNADNTISYRTAAQTLSDLGAESALTFSTGLTRAVNTITIDSTVVTLTGAQALSNKTGLISQWTNDSGYLTSLAGAVTSVTGSGNIASSGGATPNITFTGVLPTANGGTAVNIASAALVLGTASTTAGQLTLSNATNAFTQTIRGTNPAASIIYDLPTTAPTLGQVLSATAPAAGVVTLSWATAAGGITVGTTTITSGTTGSIGMNIGGIYSESKSYRAQQATPFGTAFGFASMSGNTGVNNTAFGYNAGLGQTTGTDNLYLGYNAGFRNITGNRNIYLGGVAGDVSSTNLSDNIFIGVGAGVHCSGSSNVVIGSADSGANLGGQNTVVGYRSFWNASGSPTYNVALGFFAGYSASGHGSVYLGALAGYASTYTRAIGIGNQAQPSQNNEMMIGGVDSWFGGTGATVGITNVCIGNGNTYSTPSSVTLRITSASGSNIAGSTFTIAGSKGTGTGASGNIKYTTSVKGASGTTLQTSTDRQAIIGKYVDITESAATTFGTLALTTSGTIAGGVIVYTVEANDATDYQSLSGSAPYSVVNKAGTLTYVLGTDVQSSACSSGTLTGTLGLSASGTSLQFQMNAVSSLAQTTLRISFQVLNNMGVAIISPA